MASTNKTTNYELSQFLGTDKPAWLSDYNTDMSKIDTQMKANADAATAATGSATTANTAIGTLANLTTDDKASLVNAINEVDGHADTAQNTANTASSTANAAKTEADGLAAYLTLGTTGALDGADITIGAGSINLKNIRYATNTAGSLGKLYGYIYGVHISGATTITLSNLPFTVSSQFTVSGMIEAQDTDNKTLYFPDITFNTDGTATITMSSAYTNYNMNFYLLPILLFITNFGD